MERVEITEKVVNIISEKLGIAPEEITEEKHFTQDLNADSLDTVELMMSVEKEFGVRIPDEEAQNIATVGDVITYVEKNIAQ